MRGGNGDREKVYKKSVACKCVCVGGGGIDQGGVYKKYNYMSAHMYALLWMSTTLRVIKYLQELNIAHLSVAPRLMVSQAPSPAL